MLFVLLYLILLLITYVTSHLVHIWNHSFIFGQNTDFHVNDCLLENLSKALSYSVNSENVLNVDVKNRTRAYREPEQVSMKYQYNKYSTFTIISAINDSCPFSVHFSRWEQPDLN